VESADDALRAMHAMAVQRPGPPPDEATLFEFDRLLSQARLAGPDAPLDYTLAAPKWQFLCHVADKGGYVLHGSGNGSIDEFEPRQPIDITDFGNRLAVYAASDALWAMYFAIVDRDRYVKTLYNACYRLGPAPDGPYGDPYYFFSINDDAHDHVPWRSGTVYLLPAEGFEQEPPMQVDDYWVRTDQVASPNPVRPIAKVVVEPDDFPLLANVRGHDAQWRVTR
jgi:hypothetical protein